MERRSITIASLGSISADLNLNLGNFDSNINKAIGGLNKLEQSGQKAGKSTEDSFQSLNGKLVSVGNDVSKFGGKMTKGVTLPLVGAGIASLKMASDMEVGVAKVSTVADMSKISIDQIGTSIVDMSNKTGMSTNELNEALYQTISAGIDTGHAVQFLGEANKLATGGFTSSEKAVDLKKWALC